MSKYICTAERNGQSKGFCHAVIDGECYAFWNNMQQIPCPWVNDKGNLEVELPPVPAGITDSLFQEIARRIFGEGVIS